jgi:phage terminase large subunit GpA-like protein
MPASPLRVRRAIFGALRRSIAPTPRVMVSDWAAEHRWVAGEASSRPGRWSNELTPYLVEVMDALSFADPCREVVFKKSAQIGASEVGLNWLGSIIHRTPMPVLVALPKHASVGKYAEDKLENLIAATPEVRRRVAVRKSRSRKASTTRVKRFPGGSIRLVNAASSSDMQSDSARALLCEEVTEYEPDVKGLGDPVSALRQRTEGYARERKIYFVSTPGIARACRISELYAASDRAVYYVPCPHCGHYQVLTWPQMKWRQDRAPFGAYFACSAHGCVIEQAEKRGMVAAGVWIRTFDGGESDPPPPAQFAPEDLLRWRARRAPFRARGFWIWRAYSPFSGWDDIVAEHLDAQGDPQKEKQFTLKVLGLEYEEQHDVPAHQVLHMRREAMPEGRVPPWCLFLTGSVDVQGNRLEWGVYGWDRHYAPTKIDGGILIGDPGGDEVWAEVAQLLPRTWPNAWGRDIGVEAWGIDSGGHHTHRVYRFVRPYAAQERPRVMALKGVAGWDAPPVARGKPVDITFLGKKLGEVVLWLVGTWSVKSAVARALRLTEQGPDRDGIWPAGAARFPMSCDIGFFEQLTAEACVERQVGRRGTARVIREWVRLEGRPNEQLDLLVYAMALAQFVTARFSEAEWIGLARARQGAREQVQPDMLELLPPPIEAEALAAAPASVPAAPPPLPPHVAARLMPVGRRLAGLGRSLR